MKLRRCIGETKYCVLFFVNCILAGGVFGQEETLVPHALAKEDDKVEVNQIGEADAVSASALQKKSKKRIRIDRIQPYKKLYVKKIFASGNEGSVKLTNLNYLVNRWYLLEIVWPNTQEKDFFHIENPFPEKQALSLDPALDGIVLQKGGKKKVCNLWTKTSGYPLRVARVRSKPYAPLCEGRVQLRNRIEGYRTTKEWVVEFLRDNVWGGESITSFVKTKIFKDRYLIKSEISKGASSFYSNVVQRSYKQPKKAQLIPSMKTFSFPL